MVKYETKLWLEFWDGLRCPMVILALTKWGSYFGAKVNVGEAKGGVGGNRSEP